jgi:hypothetical protein
MRNAKGRLREKHILPAHHRGVQGNAPDERKERLGYGAGSLASRAHGALTARMWTLADLLVLV